jgi:hypothetical protein
LHSRVKAFARHCGGATKFLLSVSATFDRYSQSIPFGFSADPSGDEPVNNNAIRFYLSE